MAAELVPDAIKTWPPVPPTDVPALSRMVPAPPVLVATPVCNSSEPLDEVVVVPELKRKSPLTPAP